MPPRLALVSTPWPLFDRPSIQLGTLGAFIQRELPRVRVETHHLYLEVARGLGWDRYRTISESTWLGECLYGALLDPGGVERLAAFWDKRASRHPVLRKVGLKELSLRIQEVTEAALEAVSWEAYDLVGFSVCFAQLTSTLYALRNIRQKAPGILTVVGGSSCAGEMGQSLLEAVGEIDYVIQGEGELPLVGLIRRLEGETREGPVAGLLWRGGGSQDQGGEQIQDLDGLPFPDYRDYFRRVKALGPEEAFQPKLPMEMSRGCWWGRCAFCNLNVQWKGYRAKSPDRIVRELDGLSRLHETLSISFMDNLLPLKGARAIFEGMQALGKDFRLFGEIRAGMPQPILQLMGRAGVREVQVGIEALGTELLRKLGKGTRAIDNVEIMKRCETPGYPRLTGNLIAEFPSSDEKDVRDTLRALEFVAPFRPLRVIPFWLGYGSAVCRNAGAFGIREVRPHPHYEAILGKNLARALRLPVMGYRGPVRRQRALWRPVREAGAQWEKNYRALHASPGSEPILSYQDGGDFLVIRERRLGKAPLIHRLRKTSREIYLFCDTQRPFADVARAFPGFSEGAIRRFLELMVQKRLMFQEGERFLSLAVPRYPFR